MLKSNPMDRLSSKDCVVHKWFEQKIPKFEEKQLRLIKGALTNFSTFTAKNRAKVSIYSFFAKELLSKGELAVVTTVFKSLDREGDGRLSVDELLSKYQEYGIPMKYELLEEVFRQINMGQARPREQSIISFSQFCMAAMN